MAESPLVNRPAPVRDAFRTVGAAIAFVGTLVNALVSLGLISAAQGTALEGVANAVPGVIELVVLVLVAFGVIKRASAEVTPAADPAAIVNGELVALVPDPEQLAAALEKGRHAA